MGWLEEIRLNKIENNKNLGREKRYAFSRKWHQMRPKIFILVIPKKIKIKIKKTTL